MARHLHLLAAEMPTASCLAPPWLGAVSNVEAAGLKASMRDMVIVGNNRQVRQVPCFSKIGLQRLSVKRHKLSKQLIHHEEP